MSKTVALSLVILLFSSFACQRNLPQEKQAQTVYLSLYGLDMKTYENKVYVKDTLFSGVIYALNPETKDTLLINPYQNGKADGEWKSYYPNKVLQSVRYFNEGKKEGQYLAWWKNGQKKLDYSFVNDEYDGTCKEWNEQGLLIKEANYRQGHEEGSQKVWYDNGKIKANYIIQNGRRYGLLGTKNCKNVSDSLFK